MQTPAATLVDLFAPFGLSVVAGPLELRGITDEILVELCDLATRGIHSPDRMPFYFPWTRPEGPELLRNTAAYHWAERGKFGPDAWTLHLAAYHEGELVGTQSVTTRDFLLTRTGETGSWLGVAHQGRGIGTLMRQVICALAFDHLDFGEVTSAAFTDNPASLKVSERVGYRPSGDRRIVREGKLAIERGLVLRPDDLVRAPYDLEVTGLGPVRAAVGLAHG